MKNISKISKQNYEIERALYGIKDAHVFECKFEGKTDGESPLKETRNICVEKCYFDLRYPLWHVNNLVLKNCEFTINSRAPLWYDKLVSVKDVKSNSPKVFRECKLVHIESSTFESDEPFWKITNFYGKSSKFSGNYAFFCCKNVYLEDVEFSGKYSFQYSKKVVLKNSTLNTKDAFWHTKRVYAENCTIKGEYIGWYSKRLKFVNCTIESHQPFCYSKHIKFVNCKMPNSDLAFENSIVSGSIKGKILSIKNPKRAHLKLEKLEELIQEKPNQFVHLKIIN